MQVLLKQSPAGVDLIADTFNLTQSEKYLLLEASVGEGIFFAGAKHAAIKIIASYTEDQLVTTNPEQLLEIESARKELEESFGEAAKKQVPAAPPAGTPPAEPGQATPGTQTPTSSPEAPTT